MPTTTKRTQLVVGVAALSVIAGVAAFFVVRDPDEIAIDTVADATSRTTYTSSASTAPAASDMFENRPTGAKKVPFSEGIDSLNDELDSAAGDVCALLGLVETWSIANPMSSDEVRVAGEYFRRFVVEIADAVSSDTTPQSDMASRADIVRDGASLIPDDLEAAGYDPARFNTSLTIFDKSTKYGQAFQAITVAAGRQC